MNEYLILGKDNNIIGTSSIDLGNCVQAHFKPFCRDVAKWNGKGFSYNIPVREHKKTERQSYKDTIFEIGTSYSFIAKYINGTETREHNGNISVLIPCYKKSEYLMTAVKSCFKQTQKPTEVVVLLMDEDSYKLENDLLEMGVTVYKEPQMNVCKARTYLAEKCKTDWLIFLDADDFLLRDCIEILDSKNESACFGKWVTLSDKELEVDLWNGDAFTYNRKEFMLRQNMTALMHKDVFFDFGLKEEFADGGEDFDFLIRLGSGRKWSFSFDSRPTWVYRRNVINSLTKDEKYYVSYLNVLIANIKEITEQFNDVDYIGNIYEQYLFFLKNPTAENLRKLSIIRALCKRPNYNNAHYSDFDFIEQYIQNEFDYYANESMRRDTDSVFNEEDYVAVNCDDITKTFLYNSQVKNSTFDAIIFNCDVNDVEKFISEPKSYYVRKDIQKEIEKQGLSNVDTVFYLLKNYSCFIKNDFGENLPKRLVSQEDKFVTELGKIKFDETIEESAKFVQDVITYGLFNTKGKDVIKQKRTITVVLHKKCNKNCSYCPQTDKYDPLSDDEIFANFDKVLTKFENEIGDTFILQIMGGETTLWSDYLQNKILERCKNYKNLHIFTNGANKECPLYKDDRVVKHLHLLDWKNQIHNKPRPKELYDVIIEDNDNEGLKILEQYKNGTMLHILPCKDEKSGLLMSIDFLKKLASINNRYILNNHIKNFVNEVEEGGYEKARSICRNGKRPVIEVDCTRMTVRPCSNSRVEYPFDEYDFTKLTPESECAKCMFTY